jgi:hypothetical protein
MENIIPVLIQYCDKKHIKNILSLGNVSCKLHNKIKNMSTDIIKSYYILNKSYNLPIITFNLVFLYYLSWCNIKDITFLEDLQNKSNQKKIKISSFVVRRLHIKLNNNYFKEYKRLQYILYHHNFIYILYNNYYNITSVNINSVNINSVNINSVNNITSVNNISNFNQENYDNMLLLIRLGCSCKIINNNLLHICTNYFLSFIKNINYTQNNVNHLLILRYFLIFCDASYSKLIYQLKCNKLIDYNTRKLLDKYIMKKKFITNLQCKHGIIL